MSTRQEEIKGMIKQEQIERAEEAFRSRRVYERAQERARVRKQENYIIVAFISIFLVCCLLSC